MVFVNDIRDVTQNVYQYAHYFLLLYVPWTGEDIIECTVTSLVLFEDLDVGTITCSCSGSETNRPPAP